MISTRFPRSPNKDCVNYSKQLLHFLLGNPLTKTLVNIFIETFLNRTKFHYLMDICVSWILLIEFLIWIIGISMKKKTRHEATKWWDDIKIDKMCWGKHKFAFGKEWKRWLIWFSCDYYYILHYIFVNYRYINSD